jgi:hypothetical protein
VRTGRQGPPSAEAGLAYRAWRLACVTLLAGLHASLQAQGLGLEVRPADRELLTHEPRQIATVAFQVRNGTGRPSQFEGRLALPAGWRAITPEFPFELATGQTGVRLVSFTIPEAARAGDYPVTYEVRDRAQPALRDAYSIRVRVVPLPKLQLQVLETEDFAIAGETYHTTFLLSNTGNVRLRAEFQVRTSNGSKLDPERGTVELEPGESQRVSVKVSTHSVRRREQEFLTFTARIADSGISESTSSGTHLVPRVSAEQAYHSLPAQLSLSNVSRLRGDKRGSAWQAQLAGSGALDEENTKFLSFVMRGPDTRGESTLGTFDEYAVDYRDANTAVGLGDGLFALSPLTEFARYGRGARLAYQKDGWGLSGYRMEDRFSSQPQEQTALNANYQVSAASRVDVNVLDKRGPLAANVYSLRGQTQWSQGLFSDVEAAQSDGGAEQGRAFRANLFDGRQPLRYYATAWRGDPGYRGYYRDQEYLSAGFDYPYGEQTLRGYYRRQQLNLHADPARAAPLERHGNLGADRRLPSGTRVSLDYNQRRRADQRALSEFESVHHSGRLGASRAWNRLSLYYSGEFGQTKEPIKSQRFNTVLHLLSASWMRSEKQTYSAFLFYDNNAYSFEQQPSQTTLGVNGTVGLSAATFLYFTAQVGRSANASARSSRLVDLLLAHQLSNGDRISAVLRRIQGSLAQTDLLLTYTVPFDLPLRRKANVSALRGRVLDKETGAGLPRLVLNLDGLTAVSGENGEFAFPAVKAGTYQLMLDRSNVGVDKVPVQKLPLEVVIPADAPARVDIALVRSATIVVRVNLYPEKSSLAPPRPPTRAGRGTRPVSDSPPADHADHASPASPAPPAPMRGLDNILVTLRSETHLYRRLTDASGQLRLGGLPPGKWSISIAAEALPEGYEAQDNELQLELAPGGLRQAEFRLLPRTRGMRMLEPLKVM